MTPDSKIVCPCRLCGQTAELFFENDRKFFKCPECWLIFTNEIIPQPEQENHYQNQWQLEEDQSWDEKADILLSVVTKYRNPQRILDFGSGSGKLTMALHQKGLDVTPLEPMVHGYLKDQNYSEPFDVVMGIEVIEHLMDFHSELKEIDRVLAPDGLMLFSTLMTEQFIQSPDLPTLFSRWWYKDDPTHVSFFCARSLGKLAELGQYQIDIFQDKLFVVQKQTCAVV